MKTIDTRRLQELAADITDAIEEGERSFSNAVEHAIRAGEGLIEAKSLVKHGEWLRWLTDNFGMSRDIATKYMRIARNSERVMNSVSLRQALRQISPPRDQDRVVEEPEEIDDNDDQDQTRDNVRSVAQRLPTLDSTTADDTPDLTDDELNDFDPPDFYVAVHVWIEDADQFWSMMTGDYLADLEDHHVAAIEQDVGKLEKVLDNLKAALQRRRRHHGKQAD